MGKKVITYEWLVGFFGKERRGLFREMSDYNIAKFFEIAKRASKSKKAWGVN